MELKDLFLTPLYLLLNYSIAFWIRSKVTNKITKKYFMPALTVKLIGAIAMGLIYQFYYSGGDTFNYYHQSKIINQAFDHSLPVGIKLLLAHGEYDPDTYSYTSRMYWYRAPTEYFIIRLAGFISLFTFNTYTVIALFFASISFSGMWAMYQTFFKQYPSLHKNLAIAVFFLPSVFFWGSGLMKDSITIGALGWLYYGFYKLAIAKKSILTSFIITLVAAYVIYSVKVYVLLSFLPPALFWIFLENNRRIKSAAIRIIAKPIFIVAGLVVAYVGATTLTAGDARYDVNNLAQSTKINSDYLSTYQASGSAYHIGTFDGSMGSVVKVAPQAIIVALYRPFLWEVRNPVMLLSALEATLFIFLTIRFIFRTGLLKTFRLISSKPILTFCLVFALVFAFGTGTNSGNFGTLVRYKIPLMPFYLAALYIMEGYAKRPKKSVRIATTA